MHHPIFKGKPVNHDPRERFIAEYMARQGRYNVFHAFYRELVRGAARTGGEPVRLLRQRRRGHRGAAARRCSGTTTRPGALTERDLETAAFTVFLYGRMIGAAAEIDDHLNRGRNMDTRTPASACGHVI